MKRLKQFCQPLLFVFYRTLASIRSFFFKFYLARPAHPDFAESDLFMKLVHWHSSVYYIVIFNLWLHMTYWHLCFFFFACAEFFVFTCRSLWREVWVLRILVLFLFIAAFWTHKAADCYDDIDMIIGGNIARLSLGFFSADWLVDMSNSVVAIHWLLGFIFQYFLAIYLPIVLVISALLAPLISALAGLLLGHRLGYVLVGRFAIWCIFFSSASFWYLWLVYPIIWCDFMSVFYRGKLDSVQYHLAVDEDFVYWDIVPVDHILLEYTNMASDNAFLLASESDKLYLPINLGRFISTPLLEGGIDFCIDSISIVMVSVITIISFFVHFYSSVYMANDPHLIRFYGYLSLFTFFMLVLVMASNMIILYIGWEGVGLSSYLLISFWYTRLASVKAATKAMLINKIGDMFLLAAAAIVIHFSKGSTTIAGIPVTVSAEAFAAPVFADFTVLDVLAVCLVLAAFVKSAQIFFHTWLADAMEGPTPVSALLHAATMVTAGVYLVIRFSIVIEFSALAKVFLIFGGFFTVIVSSCIALAQYDIKKIIAYSTCSQLGLMFFGCGLSGYDFALYHFFNHAFFKCLLFLLAGVIIHELRNEQDIRRMGGLWKKMPFSAFFFGVASLSLAGLPGFSGAVSKDYILALGNYTALYICDSNILVFFFLFFNLSIYLTAFYSFRLFYYVFMAPVSTFASSCAVFSRNYVDASFMNARYFSTFVFLSIMSILSGVGFKMQFISGNSFFDLQSEVVALTNYNASLLDYSRSIVFLLTLHALLVIIFVICYSFLTTSSGEYFKPTSVVFVFSNCKPLFGLFKFFNKKCYFDEFYNLVIIRPLLHLSYVFNTLFEGGIFNFFSSSLWRVTFLPWSVRFNLDRLRMLQNMYFCFGSLAVIYIVAAAMSIWL